MKSLSVYRATVHVQNHGLGEGEDGQGAVSQSDEGGHGGPDGAVP